ncbi:MAG: hypothetical protein EXX96DRAFT_582177 [Benjaminiella poitrasii]|nr:MAG: hypothetical protein EXX96DRAFT_582177 [Benjaminiella poitrasii]
MILPTSEHFPPLTKEAVNAPTTKQPMKYKTYSKAFLAKQQESLIHKPFLPKSTDKDNPYVTHQSRIYRSSRTPGAWLFNISLLKKMMKPLFD